MHNWVFPIIILCGIISGQLASKERDYVDVQVVLLKGGYCGGMLGHYCGD
jgi:hypothetical protein